MKKNISIITSALTAFSTSSLTAFSDVSFDFSDDSVMNQTHTRIVGDLNEDGEINVGDLVIMTHIMHGNIPVNSKRYYDDVFGYTDLNFDLTTDIFDLVELRKLVISPEKAFKIVSDADILSSADKTSDVAAFIRSPEDITSYLSGIGTSEEEIQKYLDIYDDDFFKDSDAVFGTLVQEYGNGVHFIAPETMFLHGRFLDILEYEEATEYFNIDIETLKKSHIFFLVTTPEYNSHPMLYPKTDKIILFRITVPKDIYNLSNGLGFVWSFELFSSEYAAHRFDSPDGKHHIYITTEADSFMDDYCNYMFFNINSDGSYKYYGEYYDYDCSDKFSCDYIPTTDNNNNTVYKFSDNARITWKNDRAAISFKLYEWDNTYTNYTEVWKTIAEIRYV